MLYKLPSPKNPFEWFWYIVAGIGIFIVALVIIAFTLKGIGA